MDLLQHSWWLTTSAFCKNSRGGSGAVICADCSCQVVLLSTAITTVLTLHICKFVHFALLQIFSLCTFAHLHIPGGEENERVRDMTGAYNHIKNNDVKIRKSKQIIHTDCNKY